METVVPRTTPQGPTVSAPAPTAQIASPPPPALSRLELGAKLEALVLQGTTKGLVELETPFGKLQLTSKFPLPPQAALQLQIIGKFPQLQFLITSVQGQSPQASLRSLNSPPPQSGAATTSQGGGPVAGAATTPATVSLTVGTNVVATKTGPATPPNSSGATSTSLPAGSVAPSQSAAVIPPGGQTTGLRSTLQNTGLLALQTAKSVVSGATGSKGPSAPQGQNANLNQAGTSFSVRITQILPPSQLANGGGLPASGSTSLAVGQTATGVVTAVTTQGQAVVQTHAGTVNLATPSPLPPGTTVSFLINGPLSPATNGVQNTLLAHSAEIIMETHKWPQLDEAVRTLSEGHPSLGQQVVNSLLPKSDATLAANIILLIAALRGGDIRNWFGDAPVRALQRLKPDLMARLHDDFSQIRRLSDDTSGNDWRSYPVPFLNGQEIEQIRLFVRQNANADDEDETDANQGTRFVIDLDLRYMGQLQLDGLVRSQKKQFDLIIRSDNPLAMEIQNAIRGIFQTAMEQMMNNGGLTFQSAPANFVDIRTDGAQKPDMGIIV